MYGDRYDQWLTTDPRMDEPDVTVYKCDCGAFLRHTPDSTGYESHLYPCPGMPNEYSYDSECDRWREPAHEPHWFVDHAVTLEFRICRRCGAKNTEVIF